MKIFANRPRGGLRCLCRKHVRTRYTKLADGVKFRPSRHTIVVDETIQDIGISLLPDLVCLCYDAVVVALGALFHL